MRLYTKLWSVGRSRHRVPLGRLNLWSPGSWRISTTEHTEHADHNADLHMAPTGPLGKVWGLHWIRVVSVMVELGTQVQKLTGKTLNIGKINYEIELVALDFPGGRYRTNTGVLP